MAARRQVLPARVRYVRLPRWHRHRVLPLPVLPLPAELLIMQRGESREAYTARVDKARGDINKRLFVLVHACFQVGWLGGLRLLRAWVGGLCLLPGGVAGWAVPASRLGGWAVPASRWGGVAGWASLRAALLVGWRWLAGTRAPAANEANSTHAPDTGCS